jgi:hypothetical protein
LNEIFNSKKANRIDPKSSKTNIETKLENNINKSLINDIKDEKESMSREMPGHDQNNRYKSVQVSGSKDDETISKLQQTIVNLKKKNNNLAGLYSKLSQDIKNIEADTSQKIEEGKEYILDNYYVRTKSKMSDFDKNNMSVNILSNTLIGSQEANISTVEMSDLIDNAMSDNANDIAGIVFHDTNHDDMSVNFGHLSSDSDNVVDNYFDANDILDSETRVSDVTKNMSGHFVGHNNRSNILSDFSDNQKGQISNENRRSREVVNLSGYAVRLMDEKEKVINNLQEQNTFLKNELKGLSNEFFKFDDTLSNELKNRTAANDLLINNNKILQERLITLIDNQLSNEKISTNTQVETKTKGDNNNEDMLKNDQTRVEVENLKKELALWQKSATEIKWAEKQNNIKLSDLHQSFLMGMALGMILGLMTTSLIVWLILF